ncbi:TetR/AcrR family transcriptional regulator [Mycobacterium bourgelatii]|uniref:TetR family transcriptional regulator n=1 Tax=Mycobacterium bourgelatii TaxID=1273442 RepID=A0A7I9YZF8_MYCBU|nr:TetR/AcrR family transcriptional regulator [Mycobacterium bourgelatii]GFG93917.1 TetR family transcriptional regulator [Mycobacterium bourgelatii]
MAVAPSESGAHLGRPVGASGEHTRRRILTAAMRCVAQVGYTQATIREIAKAADMTSGSLYHYFPNKSELLRATGAEIEEVVLPRLRAAAAKSADVVDRLDAVLDESKRLRREFPDLAAFLRAVRAESAAQLPHGGPQYPGSRALRDVVTEIIADAQAQGLLSPETNAAATVDAICALTRGLSERAASLSPDAYDATLDSAKSLIRGTLFARTRGQA